MKITIKKALPPGVPMRTIRVVDVASSRRLLGRIIMAIQRDEIDEMKARLLVYCVSTYVNVCRDTDMEKRLEDLEKKAGIK